jgi:hypothetical protein
LTVIAGSHSKFGMRDRDVKQNCGEHRVDDLHLRTVRIPWEPGGKLRIFERT